MNDSKWKSASEVKEYFELQLILANDGKIESQLFVARAYQKDCYGKDAKSRKKASVHWYKRAADAGNIDAQYELGVLYYKGKCGITRNLKKAIEWLGKAGIQGHFEGAMMVAYIYGDRLSANYKYTDGVAVDQDLSVKWCNVAGKIIEGNAKLEYKVGKTIYGGRRGPKYKEDALYWIEKSADKNYGPAFELLADLTDDNDESAYYLDKASKLNNAEDYLKDATDLRRSIDLIDSGNGSGNTAYMVGLFYEEGRGTEVNYEKALEYYRISANDISPDSRAESGINEMLRRIRDE